VLFAKLYDVAPDGTATIPRNQISAARVAGQGGTVTIELPGLVHRFDRGHRLRLTVSATALTFRGTPASGPVTFSTDPAAPGVLTIPRLGPPTGPAGSGPAGTTPFGSPPPAKRRVRPAARLPKRLGCRDRTLRLRLRMARGLRAAVVRVNGRHARSVRGRALRRVVIVRRLPRGKVRVVVSSRTKAGTLRRSARTYSACAVR
jgi:hypothetical protein